MAMATVSFDRPVIVNPDLGVKNLERGKVRNNTTYKPVKI
jgi:hypothetical protein